MSPQCDPFFVMFLFLSGSVLVRDAIFTFFRFFFLIRLLCCEEYALQCSFIFVSFLCPCVMIRDAVFSFFFSFYSFIFFSSLLCCDY